MAYLGNRPAESYASFERQVFTIVNSQTAYTLSHSVTNENDIRLVVNNVVQEPGSGKAYTASGTTLTLSAALTNGTDEMYCVFLGRALQTVNPPNSSVGSAQIADNLISGKTALASEPADTDEFLVSDAGTLKRIDYSLIKGSGKIIQAVTATHSTAVTVTGTTFTSSGLAASITPASTSNKILILTTSAIQTFGDGSSSSGRTGKITLRRGGATDTELTTMEIGINARTADTSTLPRPFNIVTFTFLDSPSTTSSQTYTVGIRGDGACDITAQGSDRTSSITLLEVAA